MKCCLLNTSFVFFIFFSSTYGQVKLFGNVTNAEDSIGPVELVSVIAYQYQTSKIIDYTQTDESGYYQLTIPSGAAIITLKTRRIGFKPYQRDIVIGRQDLQELQLSFSLLPDIKELESVEITATPPVIVKEDTVIYDIPQWTEAVDETLEDVLADIPGFKILGNGDIELNGTAISKVLIDGEEFSTTGAALITRSISPEDVKSVEVRLDEKDEKLKESLIDDEPLVVLDIILKEELHKSFFGKMRVTAGYQDNVQPGGYTNIFSLKTETKVHFFAEYDAFGHETISLDQIGNIGAEARQKLFESSADFDELSQREAFNQEIYGFKDYTMADNGIVGLTIRHQLTDVSELFFGSYNAYNLRGQESRSVQTFTEGFTNELLERQTITDYSTRNKVQYRLNAGKIKARIDLNTVIFNNELDTDHTETVRGLHYEYSDEHRSFDATTNGFFEYKVSEKVGVQAKASWSRSSNDHFKRLVHNDTTYEASFFNEMGQTVFDFGQDVLADEKKLFSDGFIQFKGKANRLQLGLGYESRRLDLEKIGRDNDNAEKARLARFSAAEERFTYSKVTPYMGHRLSFGNFSMNNEVGLAIIDFPEAGRGSSNENLLEYKIAMNYSPGNFRDLGISLNRRVTALPLFKLAQGIDIIDFQTVNIPRRHDFRPVVEYIADFNATFKIQEWDVLFDAGVFVGRNEKADRYLFTDSPVIEIGYDQLRTEYLGLTFPVTKSFKNIPLNAILEPEWLINQSENIDPLGDSYNVRTTRTLMGLKLNSQWKDAFYNFNLYPKYSLFVFEDQSTETSNEQSIFSLSIISKFDLIPDKLFFTNDMRYVQFFNGATTENFVLGATLRGKISKFNWLIQAQNVLDSRDFIRQTIYPTFFQEDQSFIFSRFFKLSIEYKFK
ncbi:MAG: hypothetical protein AAF693_21550 [Bacteroidota bacterium]